MDMMPTHYFRLMKNSIYDINYKIKHKQIHFSHVSNTAKQH